MKHQARHQRQDVIAERRQDRLPGILGHHLVEAGEAGIGDPATLAEAVDDVVLDRAEERDILREYPEILGRRLAGEHARMLGRQPVEALFGVEFHDFRRHHGPKPLAHIAFVERRRFGNLGGGRRRQGGHGIKEAGSVADRRHQAERPGIEDVHEAGLEAGRTIGVEMQSAGVGVHGALSVMKQTGWFGLAKRKEFFAKQSARWRTFVRNPRVNRR